jgi:hypothetical protein
MSPNVLLIEPLKLQSASSLADKCKLLPSLLTYASRKKTASRVHQQNSHVQRGYEATTTKKKGLQTRNLPFFQSSPSIHGALPIIINEFIIWSVQY